MPVKQIRKLKKVLKDVEVENLPAAKKRPGAWKSQLIKRTAKEIEEPNKNTQIPPIVQDQIINDIANGKTPKDIAEKYKVSISYAKEVMLRRFGSPAGMKAALTQMCFENAAAFMGFAAHNIKEMTAPQSVLAAKLSIDAGLALEKSDKVKPVEIDFGALTALGQTISRLEKVLTPNQVKELPPTSK